MKQLIELGPFALSSALILLLTAVGLGVLVAWYLSRRLNAEIAPVIGRVLLAAVLGARVVFVWQYRDAYLGSPLEILDVRDGGWDPQAGFIVAWLYAIALFRSRPIMRKPVVAALAATSAVWLMGSVALAFSPGEGPRLPAVTLPALDGPARSLADFRGKPTIVNLWATWCAPCQRELPMFQQAQSAHPEFNFVFLNQGESAGRVREFVLARALPLRNLLLDPKGQATPEFSGGALPTTLFLDAQGRLMDVRLGEMSTASLAQRLDALSSSSAISQ